ncbi:hypothetical protein [Bradyrhizobium sp. JYMT SZCCT0180]|uniref:hypothetical protein n=1 Tax=Bradyrhizobium sp. JYMT SZCCT0180 TaxID=2807666 RepID=UPI001BACAF51|nr:hypothetical protein [Bradyrhizobium sp. JYMT SZCCT0180]MBR1210176.1 hypothetical protein [Bradyrhizobium sp. JYMT SZCCT0180]
MNDSAEDATPPSFVGPHDGRELQLMLEGKKHLSMFLIEDDVEYEDYPDKRFDALTLEGRFVKDVRVERFPLVDGAEMGTRRILYATAGEAWRIPAMLMIQDIYRTLVPGWRPDLERAIGWLLGYDRSDVELFVEWLARRHG